MYEDIIEETIDMILADNSEKGEKRGNIYRTTEINIVYINSNELKFLNPLYINYYVDGYTFRYFITSEKLYSCKDTITNAFIYLYNHKYLVLIDRYLRIDKIIYRLKSYDDIFNIVKDIPLNLVDEFLLHVRVINKLLTL